jgi:GT2 family glycosyltransferase
MASRRVRAVGVLIRTLNEDAFLGRCLDTLRRQDGGFQLDFLVVDSGSTDATIGVALERGARVVELEPASFDYSTSLNVGMANVGGEVVISLSAHAIPVDDQWLLRMIAPFEDSRVAGVASRQIPWPDAPWQEVHRLRQHFGTVRHRYTPQGLDEIVFSNAASAILRDAWRDEPFMLPAVEDLEWARRVVSAGWTIVYEPEATVYHSHAESAREQARRLIDINRVPDGELTRPRRRTVREACGLVYRDVRTIFDLDEPMRRKLRYATDVLRVAWFYVVDFSRPGTTAERRLARRRDA